MTDDSDRADRPQSEPVRPRLPAHLQRGVPDLGEPIFDEDQLAPVTHSPARVKAAVLAARPVVGINPDDLFACPCYCNCGGVTPITNRLANSSTAVRDTVRCTHCVSEGHFGTIKNDGFRTASAIEVIRHEVNPVDDELNREARIESDKLRFDESYDNWLKHIPKRYRGAMTDADEVGQRVARLRRGVSAGSGLFLIGPFGSGKTWRAYAYARQVIEAKIFIPEAVRIGSEADMLSSIDSASMWGENSAPDMMRKLLDPGVRMYVIDDVGTGTRYANPARRQDLWARLIDRIYGSDDGTNNKSGGATTLVLTTNLDPSKEKRDAFGESEPGELRNWVGDVAYDKIVALMGKPIFLDNVVSTETPEGSHRKQVEFDRNERYRKGLSSPGSASEGDYPDGADLPDLP